MYNIRFAVIVFLVSILVLCQFLLGNVQQQYLSTVFFILLPIFLKINHFLPKKYVDLFYIRTATTRMFTGFADIFLISENRFLRSTYFLIHFCLLFCSIKPHFLFFHMSTDLDFSGLEVDVLFHNQFQNTQFSMQ